MEEKRTSERVSYKKPVEFGLVRFGPPPEPPKYKGYLVDLSDGGVFIKTDRVFKQGIKLTLEIKNIPKAKKTFQRLMDLYPSSSAAKKAAEKIN